LRNPSEITVHSAIVHLIKRISPFYSEGTLQLKEEARVAKFLGAHIQHSLRHDRAQSANFLRDASDPVVYLNAQSLLADNGSLVKTSTEIAKHFQRAIMKEGRASECALAVCTYTVADEPDGAHYLAILKLEHGGAFHPLPQNKGGKRMVKLKEIPDVLPTEREELQKAALIRRPGDKKPIKRSFDLMILDRQKRDAGEPAGYFMDFLRADLAMDAYKATHTLYNVVHEEIKHLGDGINIVERETVISAVRTALGSESVEPIQLIDNLAINGTAKQAIKKKLQDAIDDASFVPDSRVVAAITKHRKFKADYGIKLTIDANATGDRNVFTETRDGDYTIVTLRTKNWREVVT